MMRGRTRHEEDEQSRALYQLSALVLNLLRSPLSSLTFSDEVPPLAASRRPGLGQISPAGFASLLLGISLALMLCGSVTFFIGFVLMPWVLGLVMLFYVAGILSSLSVFGRSILCYATSPPSPRKDIPGKTTYLNSKFFFCSCKWESYFCFQSNGFPLLICICLIPED